MIIKKDIRWLEQNQRFYWEINRYHYRFFRLERKIYMKDKYDSKNKYDSAYSLLLIVLCPMLIIILSFCYAALKQWKKGT